MYKRRFSRFPRRKILRRRRGLGKKRVPKSIKKYVKRAIHRQIENKEIIDYAANYTLQTLSSGTNNGLACRNLLPLPGQGTADNQRVGNQIRVVKGVIKGWVNLKVWDVTLNPLSTPLIVKMWIFRDLKSNGVAIANGSNTDYFDGWFRGNGATLPFQGNPLDMALPVDDTHFRVLATKQFTIGATTASSTGPVGTSGYFDNNRINCPFYFNWGKYCKKVLKYTDGTAYPQNDNLALVTQVVRADGTSSGSYQMAEYHFVNYIKFEDA